MFSNFFKSPKLKEFEYKPRYYDPEKDEEIQSDRKRIEFRRPGEYFHTRLEKKARPVKKQNRLLIYLILLLLALYFMFMS